MTEETLRQRLDRESQLAVADALAIGREVARRLGEAHEAGRLHLDVTPERIRLREGGRVELRFDEDAPGVTSADPGPASEDPGVAPDRVPLEGESAAGDPPYMSPEQAAGDSDIDGRSDLYSLGCVLYEMLAGQPPFEGPSAETILARHARDPVPPLSTARPGVSGPVESVVMKALSKLPADRFASASELARALEMAEQGVTPRGVIPVGTGAASSGARPGAKAGLGTGVVVGRGAAIALGVVAVVYFASRLSSASGGGDGATEWASLLPRPAPETSLPVDRCTWGVAPFRTSGAHADVVGLAPAAADYMAAALNPGAAAPAALAAGSDDVETARAEALERRYATLVTGSIVGGPDRITLQAVRLGTRSGLVLGEPGIVEGPVSELGPLVRRLALQLADPMIDAASREQISVTGDRAVSATLAAAAGLCRWDFEPALESAREAVAIDDRFGLAALVYREVATHAQQPVTTYGGHADSLAWAVRDRMPAAYRVRLEIQSRQRAAVRVPRRVQLEELRAAAREFPNAHAILGDLAADLHAFGSLLGIEGWAEEGLLAARRQAELLDYEGGVNCGELWTWYRIPDPHPEWWLDYGHCPWFQGMAGRWRRALLEGDTLEVGHLEEAGVRDSIGTFDYWYFHVQWGLPIDGWESALERQGRRVTTVAERISHSVARTIHLRVTGHPTLAAALADSMAGALRDVEKANLTNIQTPWFVLWGPMTSAHYEPGRAAYLPKLERRMFSFPDTLVYDPNGGWNSTFARLCTTELARMAQRDTTRTVASIEILERWREGNPSPGALHCPELLAAMLEHLRKADDDRALRTLDSLMTVNPDGGTNHEQAGLDMARIYWGRADTTNAWKWVRRRRFSRTTAQNLPAWLRTDGRISVAVGELDRAQRMYRHYLILRSDPEPGALTAQRDSVIQELACIDQELSDRRDPDVCRVLLGEGGGF